MHDITSQVRQRQENAARSVERDRKYWEDVQKTWHETTEADKAHLEIKAKVKYFSSINLHLTPGNLICITKYLSQKGSPHYH